MAYFSWRIFKGNLVRGLKTRIRRIRKIYLDNCDEDNAEYHVTRNGVDQDAIKELFTSSGFSCNIIKYFSTQSDIFQTLGELFGMKNTFAIIAQRIGSGKGRVL